MLSSDFSKYFDSKLFGNSFLGVFSSDNYPKQLKPFDFFILNQDKSFEPGSHWMACYYNGDSIEFFDSLGTSKLKVSELLNFSQDLKCFFNESILQPASSDACGQFCIYFLFKRFLNRDVSFKHFLNFNFVDDLLKNDFIVKKFCNDILE